MRKEAGERRFQEEGEFFLFFSLARSIFFPSILSGRLLLLVVDRDGDHGTTSSDDPDGGQAPLELAVGHLSFGFSGFCFWVFFFFVSAFRGRETFCSLFLLFLFLSPFLSLLFSTYPLDVVHVLGVDVVGLLLVVFVFSLFRRRGRGRERG